METPKNGIRRTQLNLESLEERTVPTYFGASGGESIAIGAVLADLPNTGPSNIVTGTGPGTTAIVRIYSNEMQIMQYFYPFGTKYTGGVYVATGDVVGDGHTDLIVASAGGMTGTVKVFEYINGGMQLISSFQPFGSNFTGGIDVAVGNVTGDIVSSKTPGNANQIVVGMATKGSEVAVYGYDDGTGTPQYDFLSSFMPYGTSYTGGVSLAVANINTQTNPANPAPGAYNYDYSSIITGRSTQLPQVAIWDAQGVPDSTNSPVAADNQGITVTRQAEYYAFDPTSAQYKTGINVAAGDTDGTRGAEIYVNLRGTGTIRIFNGQTSAVLGTISTYPASYATMVNMAIGSVNVYAPTQDDPDAPAYYVRDLVVVAANKVTQVQLPVDLPGQKNKVAGLNGSYAL